MTRGALILPDAVVSCRDTTPEIPETGAALLSSPNAETFIPIDPKAGLLFRPSERTYALRRSHDEVLRSMEASEILQLLERQGGGWTEGEIGENDCEALNRLSYAYAYRYVYGHQHDVTKTHSTARRNPGEIARLRPRPPRTHILEADPEHPGMLIETDTIVAHEPRDR